MAIAPPAALPGGGFTAAKGALGLSALGGGLDILGGLFGFFGAGSEADIAESRANILRLEAEADGERFAEQGERFKAEQAVRFLKSGVKLSGSPLVILDETVRLSAENLSAFRARSAQEVLDVRLGASRTRARGRTALLAGVAGGTFKVAKGIFEFQSVTALGKQNRKDIRI